MDIRMFFQKVRKVEEQILEPYVVVASEQTADGGKSGVLTDVARAVAARLIVNGVARLATAEEAALHHAKLDGARQAYEQAQLAGKVQIAVLSDQDLKSLKSTLTRQKG